MANDMVGQEDEHGADGRQEAPTHPVWKANLLMAGVVVLLVVLSALSVVGGR
jgi:hypothetical protein